MNFLVSKVLIFFFNLNFLNLDKPFPTQGGVDVGDVDAKALRLEVPLEGSPDAGDITSSLLGGLSKEKQGSVVVYYCYLIAKRCCWRGALMPGPS